MVALAPASATIPAQPLLQKILGSRLFAALSYPRTADRYAQLASPTVSLDEVRAEVVAVRQETPDVATLVLRPNALFRPHRAGQYVALTAEIQGVRRTRCFSLSSPPGRGDGLVEVTIKAHPGGAVTPALVRDTRAGSVVTLSQPAGEFVLPEPLPARLLFISGGSGITPVMAMLRQLVASGRAADVVFVHYARSQADVIFGDELRGLARDPRLTIHIETELEGGRKPELTEASLAAIAGDFEAREAFVCGPEPLLAAARQAFARRGAEERVHTERYTLAAASAGQGEEGRVEFRRSGRRSEGKGKPLLVMAEEAGLTPKSGCRMGICHSCKCRKLGGTTRDVRTGELSTDAGVDIQLCVSEAVGDVTLDL